VTDYESLIAQAEGLTSGVPHPIANMANVSALIRETVADLNWAGFYLLEDETLVLGPFQGKPACIEIPITKGVCGAAVRENRSQLVADVHAFPGHIACDCASRSELVVPLRRNGAVFGVLDLDSPLAGRFTEADRQGMERLCAAIENVL
jgi:GAF domain-containing protein